MADSAIDVVVPTSGHHLVFVSMICSISSPRF